MATKAKHLALSAGINIDASGNVASDTLDNLDSSQFLRSDTSDAMSGRLTIGTSSANSLVINNTDNTSTNHDILTMTSGGGGGFAVGVQDASLTNPVWNIRTYSNESIAISDAYNEYVRFDGVNNRVGIGTESPDQKLHVDGTIRAGVAGNSSSNLPALKVFSAGTNSTQSAIAIQQGTAEGDTIIFADYDPHVDYGISAVNDTDAIDFTGGNSTGSIGISKVFYSNAGEAKTAHVKMRVHLGSGLLQVGGDIETTGVFRGKIPFMVVVHNNGQRSYPDGNSSVYYNQIRHNAGGGGHNSNYNFTFTHPGYYRITTTYRYGTGGDVWTTMDLVDGSTILGTGHGTGQTANDPATNVFDYVVRIDTGNVGRNLQQRVRRLGSGFTLANTNYGDELITIVQWMGSL